MTILRWLKKPGARVKRRDGLVEVETDKIKIEIEFPTTVF